MNPIRSPRRERGHVALLLSLSIVVAATVIGASVVEVGIADARRVAHEQRRQEAQAAAEAALDRAAMRLLLDPARIRGTGPGDWMEPGRVRWQLCDGATLLPPCRPGNGADVETIDARWSRYGPLPDLFAPQEPAAQRASASYLARTDAAGTARPGWSTLHVIAEGRSADGSATARVRRSYQLHPLLRRVPGAPLEFTESANLAGGFAIETPDGVPEQAILPGLETLALLFGPDTPAMQSLDDCTSLGPASHGLLRVTGECVVSIDGAIGSADAPVLLVADSGTVQWRAAVEFFGILVLPSPAAGTTALVQANGPSTLHGALIADRAFGLTAENLTLRYDPAVLQQLLQIGARLSEVPGSWTDHR